MLEDINRLKLLQDGCLNIGEGDYTYYVLKHYKKCPVIFINNHTNDCTEMLYTWITYDGVEIRWYTGMTEHNKEIRINNNRIFCDQHRAFKHKSGDNLDLAIKTAETTICLVWFVEKNVRKLEKHLIWELKTAGHKLINRQLYNKYEGN